MNDVSDYFHNFSQQLSTKCCPKLQWVLNKRILTHKQSWISHEINETLILYIYLTYTIQARRRRRNFRGIFEGRLRRMIFFPFQINEKKTLLFSTFYCLVRCVRVENLRNRIKWSRFVSNACILLGSQ